MSSLRKEKPTEMRTGITNFQSNITHFEFFGQIFKHIVDAQVN